jgi:cell division control protein 6
METVSETANRPQNLIDVQNLFDQILQTNQLFKNHDQMHPTYMPEILPRREKEINDLANILVPALKDETPSNVFIYGKTGTGKTAVVKFVGKELLKKGEQTGKKVNFIYINCEIVDTQYRLLQNIANRFISEWNDHVPFTGWPTDEVYTKLKAMMDKEKNVTVIVLDEIDKLKGDEALYNLTRINSDLDKARVSVVGISNDLKFTDFLDSRVKSSLGEESMIFQPYDAEQLQDILRARIKTALKPGVIEDDVIPLCAALSAQEHGDARRALDLLRVSAELAERSKATKITRSHVRLAQGKIEKDRIAEVIHSLPGQQRLLLHAIRIIQRYNEHMGKQSAMTTGEIYNQYVDISKIVHYTPLPQQMVIDLISELDGLGIISARVISERKYGKIKKIQIMISSTELARILQTDEFMEEIGQVKMKHQTKLL